jgi:hypothetical protein
MGALDHTALSELIPLGPTVERRQDQTSTRGSTRVERKAFQFPVRRLPVEVVMARTHQQIATAVQVRKLGYEKFHPDIAASLSTAEPEDFQPNTVVFIARCKVTHTSIGSMRVETNVGTNSFASSHYSLPDVFQESTHAWVTRLAVIKGANQQLAKLALFKALHRYCLATQIDWIVVGAVPPSDKLYLKLGFTDVYPQGVLFPLYGHDENRVRFMKLNSVNAAKEWAEAKNPLYDFMFRTYLPDIRIFDSLGGAWNNPRKLDRRVDTESLNVIVV